MKVKINQSHIEAAERQRWGKSRATTCPITYAIRDLGYKNVISGLVLLEADHRRFKPLESAQAFMWAFDKNENPQPCVVEFEALPMV